jgi:hypothetical protein
MTHHIERTFEPFLASYFFLVIGIDVEKAGIMTSLPVHPKNLQRTYDELDPVGNQSGCHQNGCAEIDDFQSIRCADQQHADQKESALPAWQRIGLQKTYCLNNKPYRQEEHSPE